MRWQEIASGITVPLFGEEAAILKKAADGLSLEDLDERDQELVRLMFAKDLLKKMKRDGKIVYLPATVNDIWRPR
jgi:hypothetical protein